MVEIRDPKVRICIVAASFKSCFLIYWVIFIVVLIDFGVILMITKIKNSN
jgi:hypothetical protein